MRRALLLAALLCACGDTKEAPLEFHFTDFKDGKPKFKYDDTGPGPRNYVQHGFEVKSRVKKTVHLDVRIEGAAPEGMEAEILRGNRLMRESTSKGRLVVTMPRALGPFEGKLTLFSPDLPDWELTFPFSGDVVDKPFPGRYLNPRPSSVNVGEMRPGETKTFLVVLANVGTEEIKIGGWSVTNDERVRVSGGTTGGVIVPGAELQFRGVVKAPKAQGTFLEKLDIQSDAQNYPRGLQIRITGVVAPDHSVTPVRLRETAVPAAGKDFEVVIRGRKETAPFTVGRIDGYGTYLSLVDSGGKEPSREKKIRFKLKADAPTDAERFQELRILFHLEPSGQTVDWRLALKLLPKVFARPHRVTFGRVPPGVNPKRVIRLQSFTGQTFGKVTARSKNGTTIAQVRKRGANMSPRIEVFLAPGLGIGQHADQIIIETGDKDVPEVRVAVWAELVAR